MLAYWSETGLSSSRHPFFSRHAQRALTVSARRNWQTPFTRNWSFHLQYREGQRGRHIKGEGWRTQCVFLSSVMLENQHLCHHGVSGGRKQLPHDVILTWHQRWAKAAGNNEIKCQICCSLNTFSSKDFTHFCSKTIKMRFEKCCSASSKFKSIKFASQSC